MLIVLSPAKTLDYASPAPNAAHTLPAFIDEAAELIGVLREQSPAQVATLMRISDSLAALNAGRFASWSRTFTTKNAKQAILAFNGDVYDGLAASAFTAEQFAYAQSRLRILSGLYGLLRPLDLMQPYRLEMGTKLANPRGKDLYAYWGERITRALNEAMRACKADTLVNLASEEYFKAVKPAVLRTEVVTPVFEDWNGGKFKIVSFYAKRARGLMARYAALEGIVQAERLKAFDSDGYAFDAGASTASRWVFRRRLAQ